MEGITKQWPLVGVVFLGEMVQYRIEFSQSRSGWSAIRERFRNKWRVQKTIGQCLQCCRGLAVADPEFTQSSPVAMRGGALFILTRDSFHVYQVVPRGTRQIDSAKSDTILDFGSPELEQHL
jgi:hypothetical protein